MSAEKSVFKHFCSLKNAHLYINKEKEQNRGKNVDLLFIIC